MSVLKSELDDLVERRNEVATSDSRRNFVVREPARKSRLYEAHTLGLVASLASMLIEKSISNGGTVHWGNQRNTSTEDES